MSGADFAQGFERALMHQQAGALDAADREVEALLARYPGQAHALYLKGMVRSGQERFAEAASLIEQAKAANPTERLFVHHLPEIYRRLGRLDEAAAAGRAAVAAFPEDPLLWANLAAIHRDRLELDITVELAQHALTLDPNLPEAHFALAEAWLLVGDFARGWPEYEWRFAIQGAGQFMVETNCPIWDGAELDGTLLLVGDQGLGDVIQFARFIPLIAPRCLTLAAACVPELRPFMRQIWPALRFHDRWERGIDCDAVVPLSSLPRLCWPLLVPAPYLRADPNREVAWRTRLSALLPGAGRRIGLVWAGSPEHRNDFNRSTRFTSVASLAAIPNVQLVSLQRGAAQAQLAGYAGAAQLCDLGSQLTDLSDTAGLLACLDLLITVDTAVAHLAGALGRPVWILLPFAPDWRWRLNRADTPWYATARLFRQPAPGDWSAVIEEVRQALIHEKQGRHQPTDAREPQAEPVKTAMVQPVAQTDPSSEAR